MFNWFKKSNDLDLDAIDADLTRREERVKREIPRLIKENKDLDGKITALKFKVEVMRRHVEQIERELEDER